jgi:glucan-binding YG repeat protein
MMQKNSSGSREGGIYFMNKAAKKYFTQNVDKKTVTIDLTVKPTDAEQQLVNMLIAAGYKLVSKSEARAKTAKARASKETIRHIEDMDMKKLSAEQKQELEAILKGSGKGTGFFAARSYYKKCLEENKK